MPSNIREPGLTAGQLGLLYSSGWELDRKADELLLHGRCEELGSCMPGMPAPLSSMHACGMGGYMYPVPLTMGCTVLTLFLPAPTRPSELLAFQSASVEQLGDVWVRTCRGLREDTRRAVQLQDSGVRDEALLQRIQEVFARGVSSSGFGEWSAGLAGPAGCCDVASALPASAREGRRPCLPPAAGWGMKFAADYSTLWVIGHVAKPIIPSPPSPPQTCNPSVCGCGTYAGIAPAASPRSFAVGALLPPTPSHRSGGWRCWTPCV